MHKGRFSKNIAQNRCFNFQTVIKLTIRQRKFHLILILPSSKQFSGISQTAMVIIKTVEAYHWLLIVLCDFQILTYSSAIPWFPISELISNLLYDLITWTRFFAPCKFSTTWFFTISRFPDFLLALNHQCNSVPLEFCFTLFALF